MVPTPAHRQATSEHALIRVRTLFSRTRVQQHPERRRFSAVRAQPVPAELRCDVHLVEVRATDEPPEPHRDVAARPAARDDRVGGERRVVLGGHCFKLAIRGAPVVTGTSDSSGCHSASGFESFSAHSLSETQRSPCWRAASHVRSFHHVRFVVQTPLPQPAWVMAGTLTVKGSHEPTTLDCRQRRGRPLTPAVNARISLPNTRPSG